MDYRSPQLAEVLDDDDDMNDHLWPQRFFRIVFNEAAFADLKKDCLYVGPYAYRCVKERLLGGPFVFH